MFVQGYYDRNRDKVLVSERLDNGKRILNEFAPIYEFYVEDSEYGEYTSIYGERCRKLTAHNKNEWYALKKQYEGIKTYEKNFNIVNKVLYKNYKDVGVPKLHKSFIDIEVDRAGYEYLTIKELIDKACCPVNAVSVYNDWQDKLFTFMLCPETLKFEEAREICSKFENCILFESENELLACLIGVLDDMDCLSSWNGSSFDYPYIVRRIENVLGQGQSAGLCLWGIEPRCIEKKGDFGDTHLEYEFVGKWFSDYLLLYKKHERGKKESYKLDSIAELELGENKVQHEESLEDMYRQRYEDFIKYNRQDTMLVKRLDDKLKYLFIHNVQAHDICVNLELTMGTVGWGDQALINEAHDNNEVVRDKVDGLNPQFQNITPPGAFVPTPIEGLCNLVVSFDCASLYPSVLRSLNMSPETIIGQLRMDMTLPHIWNKIETNNLWKNKSKQLPDWGAAWSGDDIWGSLEYQEVMKQSDKSITIDFESGQSVTLTAKEVYNIIWKDGSNLCLSAMGTIFRTDKAGLVNRVLSRWFAQRKEYKKIMAKNEAMAIGIRIDDEELLKKLKDE